LQGRKPFAGNRNTRRVCHGEDTEHRPRQQFLKHGPFMATAAFSIGPILLVCLFLQRYIIKGVVLAGLKG